MPNLVRRPPSLPEARQAAQMRFPCPKSTSFKRRKSASKPWARDRENREDAFTDLKFLAGDQWPNAIRQQREARNRPCLTINQLPQFVNQVANTVRMNPPAIKAIPTCSGRRIPLSAN